MFFTFILQMHGYGIYNPLLYLSWFQKNERKKMFQRSQLRADIKGGGGEMKAVWLLLNQLPVCADVKSRLFISTTTLFFAITGLVCWLLFGHFLAGGLCSLLCFIGYPAVCAGLFGGIFYLFNHAFE